MLSKVKDHEVFKSVKRLKKVIIHKAKLQSSIGFLEIDQAHAKLSKIFKLFLLKYTNERKLKIL